MPSRVACVLVLASCGGCTPNVNVLGVYFPGWLVSTVVGLVIAYAVVGWLGRRPAEHALGESGLLFCALTVSFSLVTWWVAFSRF